MRIKPAHIIGSTAREILALTFLFSSAEPLLVNGTQYGHRFWLRVADMFINSSILLIVLCSVLVAVGKFRH